MATSITSRLIGLLTLVSALIIGVSMLIDYRLSRDEILERLRIQSQDTIQAAIIDMESWLGSVEGSTRFLARILEQRQYSRSGLEQMLKDIVANSEDIFGAAIALNPEQVDSPLGFAPYYFRKDGILNYADLAGESHNYQQQAWYLDALRASKPVWVEPYFDRGGGEVLMTTFAVPVYRSASEGRRELYAVVTADVALADLQAYLQRLHLGDSGFGILLSREGIILSSPDSDNLMRHYSELESNALDIATWREMFRSVLAGREVSRQLQCPQLPGECAIRLGTLQSTGWPVGVIYSESEILAPLREFQIKTVVVGLTTLLLMALAVFLVTSRITRPLSSLALASDKIARGVMDVPLPSARGNDEVARLVRSFHAMNKDLKTYIAELEAATASRSRLEGELAAARQIQMSLLPGSGEASDETQDYSLWATVRPAKSVGGDLYSYHRSGDTLYLAVGDVSDKGVPAALFMARASGLLQQLMIVEADPASAMQKLNDALEAGNENCMFLTLFFGVIDMRSGLLRFASAGHNAPALLRGGTASRLQQSDGPALGLAAGLQFPSNQVQLVEGDRIAIYTDGIDEAFDAQARMFGDDRLLDCLAQTGALAVAVAGPEILQAVERHAGEQQQSDDITLMLLQLTPRESATQTAQTVTRENFTLGESLVTRAQEWLEQTLHRLRVTPDLQLELSLVTEEILTNIEKYSGLPSGAQVSLSLVSTADALALETRDKGIAFNPLTDSHRSPLGADIESAEIGGLGVHLITQFTDQQTYRRFEGSNILRVTKVLHSDQA